MCWRPARPHSVREFVERAFARGRHRRSSGAARASRRRASTPRPARCWSRSIRATSARPRSTCCSAIRPRRAQKLGWTPRDQLRGAGARDGARRTSSVGRATRRMTAGCRLTPLFALAGKRVWVAGHRGMVGSALVRRLAREDCEVLTVGRDDARSARPGRRRSAGSPTRTARRRVPGRRQGRRHPRQRQLSGRLPLRQPDDRDQRHRGGATQAGVEKLLFLGSSCIYPKLAPQPIAEDALLTGPLEPTNEWYAIAKIAGIKLCQAYRRQYGCDFISAMPTNLYGPGDNFDLQPQPCPAGADPQGARGQACAATRRMTIWGTGTPRREFLHVDDCADALVFLMQNYSGDEPRQRRLGRGRRPSSSWPSWSCEVVGFDGRDRRTTRPSPTARRAS